MTPPVSFGSQRAPLFSLWHLFQVKPCERAVSLLRSFHPGAASRLPPLSVFTDWTLPSAWAGMNEIQEATSPATSLSGPAACVSKVELRVSCKALLDRDTLNKSDPCVIIMVQTNGQWTEVSPSLKTCFSPPLFLSVQSSSQLSTFISLTFAYTRSDHLNHLTWNQTTLQTERFWRKRAHLNPIPVWIKPGDKSVMVWWILTKPWLKWSQLTQQLSDSEQKMSDVEYIYRGESQHSPQLLINWQQIV